jgi:hypothetical protein
LLRLRPPRPTAAGHGRHRRQFHRQYARGRL